MAWSFGLRLHLVGECRIGSAPAQPAAMELSLRRANPGRFYATGTLSCAALGDERPIAGLWLFPGELALALGDGWSFVGNPDPTAPRSLLGRSLWTGPLTQDDEARGSLHLRLDLRRDWLRTLRSVRL